MPAIYGSFVHTGQLLHPLKKGGMIRDRVAAIYGLRQVPG